MAFLLLPLSLLIYCRSCLAVLNVPTTLVGHLQLLSDVLVTGDTGGALYKWSMDDYSELQKICAHERSIISMQIYGSRIVTGGFDGKVKEWDLESGELIRELTHSCVVWKVGYARGRTIATLGRQGNVVLEVSPLYNLGDSARKCVVFPLTHSQIWESFA